MSFLFVENYITMSHKFSLVQVRIWAISEKRLFFFLFGQFSGPREGRSRNRRFVSRGVSVDSRKFIFNKLADRSDFALDSRYEVTRWNASESTDRG